MHSLTQTGRNPFSHRCGEGGQAVIPACIVFSRIIRLTGENTLKLLISWNHQQTASFTAVIIKGPVHTNNDTKKKMILPNQQCLVHQQASLWFSLCYIVVWELLLTSIVMRWWQMQISQQRQIYLKLAARLDANNFFFSFHSSLILHHSDRLQLSSWLLQAVIESKWEVKVWCVTKWLFR